MRARPRRPLRQSRWAGVVIAAVSTLLVLVVLAWVIGSSSGWPRVQETFFDGDVFAESWGGIVDALKTNLVIFTIAEFFILICALLLAMMRNVRSPVLYPLRAFAIVYVDLFRGVPSILVVYLLGFGIPALKLPGVPTSPYVWGTVALILVWTAYVSEVYRAGIESVHPSQDAAARSLGMTGAQSMRFVVLPQAVRRVIPPLMNDAIGLTKDTALLSFIGPIEAFRRSQMKAGALFDFTPYVVAAVLFLLLTIPMARASDWLVSRDRARSQAGGR
ncbi:MAG: amino acid ABC transporter permease [Chloroflexota bacterium]